MLKIKIMKKKINLIKYIFIKIFELLYKNNLFYSNFQLEYDNINIEEI